MKPETAFREEWAALRVRRERSRRRWRRAVAGLSEHVRDPLGLGAAIRKHPLASAGLGAAAGALLGGLLLRGARNRGKDGGAAPDAASPPARAPWADLLRDAAVGVVVPWLLRTLGKHFTGEGDAVPASTPSPAAPDRDAVPSPTKEVAP